MHGVKVTHLFFSHVCWAWQLESSVQSTQTERAMSQSWLLAVQSLSDVHAPPGVVLPPPSFPIADASGSPPAEFPELPQPPTPKKAARYAPPSARERFITFMCANLQA
jgi:hypothetical protein